MQRLIEQPAGEGEVLDGAGRIGPAHYHLRVYRHFSEQEGELVPAHFEIEGRMSGFDFLDLSERYRNGAELTLRLADGRLLDFLMVNENGDIHSTGRGLYEPARNE